MEAKGCARLTRLSRQIRRLDRGPVNGHNDHPDRQCICDNCLRQGSGQVMADAIVQTYLS